MNEANALPSQELLARYAPLRPVAHCPGLLAHQADDVFGLWAAWENESGGPRDVPFWAVVWPGASVLAAYLLHHTAVAAGRRVLDLGCGGGLAGIAAARSGACSVVSNDIDPAALHVAALNGKANGTVLSMDQRDLTECGDSVCAEVVLAADLFYQRGRARTLARYLRIVRDRGCDVLVADGERPFGPREGYRLLETSEVSVCEDLEGKRHRRVRLLSMV